MTPSTPSSTTPDTRTPAVPTRTPDDFDARRVAWNARGGEHDRGIRDRLGRAGTIALVAVAPCAAAWLSFGGAR